MEQYDIIIIGSGAGGGTLAHRLAPSGKSILILERGDYVPREMDNWNPQAVFVDEKYHADETWFDKEGTPFKPGIHYNVGGNTKFYGAALLRFRKEDFDEIHHYDGVSPAWPLSYDDFRPYYAEAEKLYWVHGERGSDPTEPMEWESYPYPPLPHEPRIQQLYDELTHHGYNPFPLPMGVRTDGNAPYTIENFDGFPDPTELKADAHVVAVKPALAYKNVTLVRNAFVERLASNDHRVTGVVTVIDGKKVTFMGDTVVVACGAVNSAALLLKSSNVYHPDGLANGSGVVGRHYMFHNNSAMIALSLEPNHTKFGKTFGINDYYFATDEHDFPLGHIQMLGKSRPEMLKGDAPFFAPGWTLEKMAEHALDFWMTTEDLPDPDNRVTIRPDGSIQITYTPNNTHPHKLLQDKLKQMIKESTHDTRLIPNTVYLRKNMPLAAVAHQCGTVRFGDDPATSALDVNCKAHELDNLYVVDASFFVSSTSVNPGLTIIANALRVGDHLLEQIASTDEQIID